MSSAAAADAPPSRHAVPKSSTVLQSATQNVAYLLHPDKEHAPKRFRTRAFLRTFRYFAVFAFWRLVRYAKYVAVGALTAAVAGSAIGSVISGAAFIVAPTGILGGAGVGLLWGMGKFGWRILGRRFRHGETHGADPRKDERADAEGVTDVEPVIPIAEPW